ncbi:MAG TPA: hypothetical protein VII72_12405 [Myxococcota bacterium]|jgi:hypothetical protein
MSVLSRLRGWAAGPRLDPRWVERVRTRFESGGGYADYHAFCRSRSTRAPAAGPAPILEQGRERIRVLDAAAAAQLQRDIETRFACLPTVAKSRHLRSFDLVDERWTRALLERIVTREVDERAARFFGSEFLVYQLTITRATPVRSLGRNSFRWHCDRGPVAHLKLLLYLNGYGEHGGGTQFLDLETTRGLLPSGYVYAPVKTRVTDLAPLAARAGVAYAPWAPEMRAGEGILFQPAGVLHRGLLPTHGHRDVVTLCLLPSPIPWREAYDRARVLPVAGEDKWHEHAAQLRDALDLRADA